MPRVARQKTNDSIYHVMCRSISEVKLFKSSDDKLEYIKLIKKYQTIYRFRIYCYCLMGNHAHLILDSNGADISQIMHGINFSYAQFFNRKYKRHGHLFQDRFLSKVIETDRYLITASAYIHNNPIEMKQYKNCPEKFKFSSLGVFLGLSRDPFELIDADAILALFGKNLATARKEYYDFVMRCNPNKKEEFEFKNEGTQYNKQVLRPQRNVDLSKIITYVCNVMEIPANLMNVKYNSKLNHAKALIVMLMKAYGNKSTSKIADLLGNITESSVSRLLKVGLNLYESNQHFCNCYKKFQLSLCKD